MSVTSVNGQTGVVTVDLQNTFDAGAGTLSLNASNLTITDTSSGSQDGVTINTNSTGAALKLSKSGLGPVLSIGNDALLNGAPLIAITNTADYGPTIAGADNALDGDFPGGTLIFQGGNKTTGPGPGGFVSLQAGSSEDDEGGGVFLVGGPSNADAAPGGVVSIAGGAGKTQGGNVYIVGGGSMDGVGGDIELITGGASSSGGKISLKAINGLILQGNYIDRSTYTNPGFIREKYIHSIDITGGGTSIASQLTFDSAVFDCIMISYRIKDNTTGQRRIGTLMVATNGTTVSLVDTYTETENVGVTWSAALSGTEVRISYTATPNNKVMHADIKSFMA